MWIARDLEKRWSRETALPVRLVRGLRQAGKTSFLERMAEGARRPVLSLDDLGLRQTAQTDPGLLFEQFPPPVIVDEVQYAPELFPEIKRRVDVARADRRRDRRASPETSFWLTGSNQILLQKAARESLAGRVSAYLLHPLSVAELAAARPGPLAIADVVMRGGWPELHVDRALSPVRYLNDYIATFIEKDIAQSASIEKLSAFSKMLGLLAARTATLLNASEIGAACGVSTPTIQEWIGVLERNFVMHLLTGYHSNLSKRLLKAPKLYFLDAALAGRLQGWSGAEPLLKSPQIRFIFETLVLSEIIKTRDHMGKGWSVHYWRTKEGKEIDFLIQNHEGRGVAIEAKYGIHAVPPRPPTPEQLGPEAPPFTSFIYVIPGDSARSPAGRRKDVVPLASLRDCLLELMD